MPLVSRLKRLLRPEVRLGLVLGAGAAKGLAHIRVIKVLREARIPIHCIAGSSAGALLGGLHCCGVPPGELLNIASQLSVKKMMGLFLPSFERGGLVDGERVKKFIEPHCAGRRIEELNPKFGCVATDLVAGKNVNFVEGDLLSAIRASISIPGVFVPVVSDGRILVDGGVVDPLPVKLASDMGANFILAVNVLSPAKDGAKNHRLSQKDIEGMPSILNVIFSTLAVFERNMLEMRIQEIKPDILIEPDLREVEVFDFSKGPQAVIAGETAMRAAMEELKQII